jgi:hypothetical protein
MAFLIIGAGLKGLQPFMKIASIINLKMTRWEYANKIIGVSCSLCAYQSGKAALAAVQLRYPRYKVLP